MFRVMVKKGKPFYPGLLGYLHCLLPTAVPPTLLLFQLIRGVLGVVNEKVGISGEFDHTWIYFIPMFDISTVDKCLTPLCKSVAVCAPRVIVL